MALIEVQPRTTRFAHAHQRTVVIAGSCMSSTKPFVTVQTTGYRLYLTQGLPQIPVNVTIFNSFYLFLSSFLTLLSFKIFIKCQTDTRGFAMGNSKCRKFIGTNIGQKDTFVVICELKFRIVRNRLSNCSFVRKMLNRD